jgi:hypothetical protein
MKSEWLRKRGHEITPEFLTLLFPVVHPQNKCFPHPSNQEYTGGAKVGIQFLL